MVPARSFPAFLGLVLLLLAVGGDADARSRTFCVAEPFYSGTSRACGGHLQPACTGSPACDAGHRSYSGSPFPIIIDCPTIKDPLFGTVVKDIPDVRVGSGCYDERPDCTACGGSNEPPCPAATEPWCSAGCEAGLEPDPTTTLCRAPGTPGSPCGPGYGCGAGLTCDETRFQCVALAQAGESCANPFVGCAPGLTCEPTSLECRHTPARLGESCNALLDAQLGGECEAELFCKAGLPSRCQAKRKPGEACGPLAPCRSGTSCQFCPLEGCDHTFQCVPNQDFPVFSATGTSSIASTSSTGAASPTSTSAALAPIGTGPLLCQGYHSAKQHRKAKEGLALTFGGGLDSAAVVGGNIEVGVAYGFGGDFGCYVTFCSGINLDLSFEGFIGLGLYESFDAVGGSSFATFQEAQTPGQNLNFSTAQVWAREPDELTPAQPWQLIGTADAFAFGGGPNPIPFSLGAYACETFLLDAGPPPGTRTTGNGPTPLPAPAPPEQSADADAGVDPDPTDPTPTEYVAGTGALYFDGVDDALAVTDPAALAALDLVTPEHRAWRAEVDACRTRTLQLPPVFNGCTLAGPATIVPTEAECISGEDRSVAYECPSLFGSTRVSRDIDLGPGIPAPSYGDGTQLTLEAWIRPEATALQGTSTVLRKEGEYELVLDGGKLAWAIAYSQGGALVSSGYAPPLGVWTHVALVYDGSGVRTYANGQPVHWAEAAGPVVSALPAPGELWLGARAAGEPFAGQLDEVRVWARALSEAELRAGLDAAPYGGSPGMLAHWTFAERADDGSVQARGPSFFALALDGLGTDRAPLRTAEDRARKGGALAFDGIDDHVAVTEPEALAELVVTDALTVEAWVRPTGPGSHPTFGGVIVSKEGEWWLGRAADGRINFALANGSPGWATRTTDTVLPENVWSHVALTYDAAGGQVNVYVDGILAHVENASGEIGDRHPEADQLRMGGRERDDVSANQRFQGLIDEVRIWSLARTPSEILETYDAPVRPGETGLLGFWRFDEGPVGMAFDASLGGRHALLGGGRIVETPKRSDALAFFDYPGSAAEALPTGSDCGLGFELALLLPAAGWIARRRRR